MLSRVPLLIRAVVCLSKHSRPMVARVFLKVVCVFLALVGSWPVHVSPLAPSQRQPLFDFYATSVPDVPRRPLCSLPVELLCLKSTLLRGERMRLVIVCADVRVCVCLLD